MYTHFLNKIFFSISPPVQRRGERGGTKVKGREEGITCVPFYFFPLSLGVCFKASSLFVIRSFSIKSNPGTLETFHSFKRHFCIHLKQEFFPANVRHNAYTRESLDPKATSRFMVDCGKETIVLVIY